MTVGSRVKQTTASLKGVKGTLEMYAAQIQDEEEATAFREAVKVTGEVITELEKRISSLEFEEPQYRGL